jgi:hypothetical protein
MFSIIIKKEISHKIALEESVVDKGEKKIDSSAYMWGFTSQAQGLGASSTLQGEIGYIISNDSECNYHAIYKT